MPRRRASLPRPVLLRPRHVRSEWGVLELVLVMGLGLKMIEHEQNRLLHSVISVS